MHSNSERSLNSPVMSGHSLSGSGLSGGGGGGGGVAVGSSSGGVGVGGGSGVGSGGRSQSQQHGRPSSLQMNTVDAMSGTGGSNGRSANAVDDHTHHHRRQQQQQQQQQHRRQDHGDDDDDDDTGSTTSSDESGNDSFTCSEIEYDNNSVSGEKLSDVIFNKIGSSTGGKSATGSSDRESQRRRRLPLPTPPPPVDVVVMAAQHQQHQQDLHMQGEQAAAGYDTFDSSFRGSLSTLVASDDDGPMYRNVRTPNNASESSSIPVGLGWDYLLNWAPSGNGMRPIMQPPPPSTPYAADRGHGMHHHHHHGAGPTAAVQPRTVDGSSSSPSRQSPKSPEEYV